MSPTRSVAMECEKPDRRHFVRVRVQKWGNRLVLRIPKLLAAHADMEEGTVVNVSVSGGRLVAAPVPRRGALLKDLLDEVTKANLHGRVDTGAQAGREAW